MAKWGEGDPRWIVEERPDATNVNNWHWTEKNADQWSKRRINELFTGLQIPFPELKAHVVIDEIEKCEGEARANNRKAKLIFFYEWEIILVWKVTWDESKDTQDGPEIKGKITIPNLSEEHTDLKDVDIEVSVTSSGAADKSRKVKDFLRKDGGARIIREALQKYVDSLKSEYSQGLILPKAADEGAATTKPKTAPPTTTSPSVKPGVPNGQKMAENAQALKNMGLSCPVTVDTIQMEQRFKCTGQEIYNTLTQKEMLQIFTGSQVKLGEAKKGEAFELLDGNIQGQFLELQPFSKIVQKWRLKSWPQAHYSLVTIEIEQGTEETTLTLTQKNVPSKEVEVTRQGWERYYWDAIKRSFGFGAMLL
ncbi:hypothetical protein TCAL_04182 [Tigriopus californicus]|uniref:Activator of Hsp90 ATPase AHSA1-like N-terminal domain-containing protein n=1 Tax=Tigriopus californicus TaxID=6832 RepID=A0A553N8E3_TIGCA|nr:activator of 90 kDa heat shock protein ATPase homolog 1-like [Tigriopus californicus]TRY61711.1 hypothetical protein TCAL_04182 [Tigriopus californicus]|eukprot:TCALIF_04182-PA protein Name:"Similar to AHSA1 Activator of 90 kDa heat shock protein ATPase homolog 1 (Homo sapiens)" AED:0.00 eAED:0.00 QI:0/-1/0/1/-1/1/1/0/364